MFFTYLVKGTVKQFTKNWKMTFEQPYSTKGFFPLANFIRSYLQHTGGGWARVINQFEKWTRRPDLYLSVRPPLLRSGPEAIFCSRAVTCDFCYYSGRTSLVTFFDSGQSIARHRDDLRWKIARAQKAAALVCIFLRATLSQITRQLDERDARLQFKQRADGGLLFYRAN